MIIDSDSDDEVHVEQSIADQTKPLYPPPAQNEPSEKVSSFKKNTMAAIKKTRESLKGFEKPIQPKSASIDPYLEDQEEIIDTAIKVNLIVIDIIQKSKSKGYKDMSIDELLELSEQPSSATNKEIENMDMELDDLDESKYSYHINVLDQQSKV